MKLINNLCSTGFWVSILLPAFFHFYFASDVKEFDNICFYFILAFLKRLHLRRSKGKMSSKSVSGLTAIVVKRGGYGNHGDVRRLIQEVNGGDRDCQHRPGGGRGNGTVAEDWRHQRKRLSFRAFQPDYSGIVPF